MQRAAPPLGRDPFVVAQLFRRLTAMAIRLEGLAILTLLDDPYPAEAFNPGAYYRLRVGDYRVLYPSTGT